MYLCSAKGARESGTGRRHWRARPRQSCKITQTQDATKYRCKSTNETERPGLKRIQDILIRIERRRNRCTESDSGSSYRHVLVRDLDINAATISNHAACRQDHCISLDYSACRSAKHLSWHRGHKDNHRVAILAAEGFAVCQDLSLSDYCVRKVTR